MLEALVNAAVVLAVSGVEIVFNAIIRSARQLFCNVGPLVAQLLVQLEDLRLLLLANRVFLDVWVQVVMPSTDQRKVSVRPTFRGTICLCDLQS